MPAPTLPKSVSKFTVSQPGDKNFKLAAIDPADKPCSSGGKTDDRVIVDQLALDLDVLQNRFWADKRFKLLVVLQGVDTSGKDGTLRHVFGRMTPLGVRTAGWKAPTEAERAHDFLWRIHQAVPAAGELVLFNRSHYEDVLVPVVAGTLDDEAVDERLAQINDFERMLSQTGTVILKFMLHISKKEQGKRLQQRLDDPEKYWKFDPADLQAREKWDAYQAIYERAIRATGTPWAPWVIVPADSKTHRNLMIATVLKKAMESLGLRFPPLPEELVGVKVK
ncbi:PPK2 family polyphosphate kinase [Ramlibacter humi]|uniref:Polyphosphate--nucleotide phosphotransferase n=1 Tax=Ramlibacter humi TaxID=2530451 RepID=A0A4Z0CAJ7_9BURK|nr:PPK2 family polyphosphate kinase [Ramlibacter humi]TFZ07932.1 polyphosphate--nucleotide phosphotransferase [Ramlibacter humi]